VTGGAGFIGHNVAMYLKERGYDVLVYDNLERAAPNAINMLNDYGITVIKGDVRDTYTLSNALTNTDTVIHAAAYVDVNESLTKPVEYINNNTVGTAAVANECLKHGIPMIMLSSAAVYGNPTKLPIPEDHPINPLSPYGLSKALSETITKFLGNKGLKYIILRPFNVYGPRQGNNYAGVIKRFIERAKQGLPPIIHGDGTQTRDFIHILDVARFIELILNEETWGETLNVGTGTPTRIIDLAKLIISLYNIKEEPIFTEPRPSDIKHSYADITKAKTLIKFQPKINLKEGLKTLQ